MIALLVAAAATASVTVDARDGKSLAAGPSLRELDVTVAARAEQAVDEFLVGLGYSPHMTFLDDRSSGLAHRADLTVAMPGVKGISGVLEESLDYGRTDLSPLAPSKTIPVAVSPVRFIDSGTLVSSLHVGESLSSRASWGASAAFSYGGGLGAFDRAVMPRSKQPSLSATAGYSLTRTDRLSAGLGVSQSWADNGVTSNAATLTAAWTHSLSRFAAASAGAGLGWTWTRLSPLAQPVWALLPTFDASLSAQEPIRGQRLAGTLHAALAPALDRLTGTAYVNATTEGTVAWGPLPDVDLAASLGFVRVVEGTLGGSQTVQGNAGVIWKAQGNLVLATGLNLADLRPQGQGQSALAAGVQWSVYLRAGWTVAARGF